VKHGSANVGEFVESAQHGSANVGESGESDTFPKKVILASTRIRQKWRIFGEYSNSTNSLSSSHCLSATQKSLGNTGLMGIKFNQILKSQISLLYLMNVYSPFAYWNHSINGITLCLAQSDPIKRLPLHIQTF
jgi:hypothetical protein